ncbi:MAG: C69 family dipeptidase [Butyricicoccus sp.]
MNMKLCKRLGAVVLSAVIAAGSSVSAAACCGLYVGSDFAENGSTYVGRSEDIGKLYDKVFEVREAADHEDGEMYEDDYGFSMPYPAHTYRYTVMRDSIEAGESILDGDDNLIREAYGEAGMNENGVSMSATVSTYYNEAAETADPLVYDGICEISLNSVVLMQAKSARDGVEKLAAIIDKHGSGECNSFTISDANEVWDFETLSGYQYVAVRMPADKVSVNPNMVVMNEIDVSDTENVIASDDLISLPLENGFLVSSQLVDEEGAQQSDETPITKIDIQKTYGATDFGNGQYVRYWQGVNYLNEKLSQSVSAEYGANKKPPEGPFDMLFDADRELSTYDVLRLLAYRGEGTKYDANETGCYAVGNENQAECHVFEIRPNMPKALATIQWQTMSRAEFSVYLPFYGNLLTDTSEIFQTEYLPARNLRQNIESIIDDENFPAETSAYWVFAALNDLCDNDRERYGTNVKKFWENYQKKLIEQQAAVDTAMKKIYAYSPALAEEKATALGKAVSEEAFGYAKSMLSELRTFIEEHANDDEVFVPTVLTENKLPTYSINMKGVDGTGIPSSSSSSSSSSSYSLTFVTNGGTAISKLYRTEGSTIDLSQYTTTRNGYTFDGWYTDSSLTEKVTSVKLNDNTTVYAKWIGDAGTSAPNEDKSDFNDVASSAWYADAVAYVTGKGIMSGTSTTTFAPSAKLTRGMIAQVLYNMENQPASSGSVFTDVASGAWYADAVNWAAASAIVSGYGNGKFGPNDNITREQMASILFRYAQFKGLNAVTLEENLTGFSDEAQISSYAVSALNWAVGKNLISGKGNGILDPKGNATRAEVAQILMNYCENIAE